MDNNLQANNPFMASVASILLQAMEANRIQEVSIITANCTQEVSSITANCTQEFSIVVTHTMAAFF